MAPCCDQRLTAIDLDGAPAHRVVGTARQRLAKRKGRPEGGEVSGGGFRGRDQRDVRLRRLIEGLLEGQTGTIVPVPIIKAFENKRAIEVAQSRLEKRRTNPDADVPVGHVVIRNYLGQGNPSDHGVRLDTRRVRRLAREGLEREHDVLAPALAPARRSAIRALSLQ